MSLNMDNVLMHMHHNKLPKEYQTKEEPDAVKVSEYWGKKSNQIENPKISFEFFPPRSNSAKESLKNTYIKLNSLNPEHYSVTFGANGKSQDATLDTIVNLSEDTNIPLTPHLTCVDTKKEQVTELIDKYISHGVSQVMVLKGDRPNKPMYKGDFKYANEMVEFIKEHYDNLDIIVAAYPEKHPYSMDVGSDIDFFVQKVIFKCDALAIALLRIENSTSFHYPKILTKTQIPFIFKYFSRL